LIEKYQEDEKKIVDFYLNNLDRVNNWDLVDLSAPKITGDYFLNREKDRLKELIFSNNLWKRRVAIVSTLGFIRKGHLDTTFDYSKLLLEDSHDLIHKAVGWMLRETGKRDKERLKEFLKENYSYMSRVTLRYSIERFDQEERDKFLRLL
jgi:3-methyladenine DNA glycosylase AlkD